MISDADSELVELLIQFFFFVSFSFFFFFGGFVLQTN